MDYSVQDQSMDWKHRHPKGKKHVSRGLYCLIHPQPAVSWWFLTIWPVIVWILITNSMLITTSFCACSVSRHSLIWLRLISILNAMLRIQCSRTGRIVSHQLGISTLFFDCWWWLYTFWEPNDCFSIIEEYPLPLLISHPVDLCISNICHWHDPSRRCFSRHCSTKQTPIRTTFSSQNRSVQMHIPSRML